MPPRPHSAQAHPPTRTALAVGVGIGVGLSGVAIAWLLVANRVPALDRLALLRNLAAGALAILFMLVPFFRFRRNPLHHFVCGLTAWSLLTAIYAILQIPFPRLALRMGTFHFFVLGAVLLGLISALLWVWHLVLSLRNGSELAARKRAH